MHPEVLEEMHQIQYVKPKGGPPYSSDLITFALMQRYTSRQSYSLLREELPLPSFSLLQKLTKGGIDPIKSLQVLLQEEKVDSECVLLIDEMYLEKSCQYHGGKFYGKDEDGELYSGIVVFMVVGLRKSIPYVIKTLPEKKISGKWLFLRYLMLVLMFEQLSQITTVLMCQHLVCWKKNSERWKILSIVVRSDDIRENNFAKITLKENVNFQSEDIRDEPVDNMAIITTHLQQMENEIQGASLMKETEEVSVYVSGYITKKLIKAFAL